MATTVDPTPSSTAPISQSMDGHFSGNNNNDNNNNNNNNNNNKNDSSSASPVTNSPDRLSSSTPSPSRQLDFQSPALTKVEEYRQLFRLPPDEVLIQDFNCAFQENFLLQGHMYLFVHNICFYSNLFGFETKKVIPFHEVTSVRRANAVGVFPTAIEVIAGDKKFFFTSFLSRDEAFRLISDGWLQHSNGSKEVKDQQEPKSEIISQIIRSSIIGESDVSRSPVDESEIIESDQNDPVVENSRRSDHDEPEIVSMSSTTQVRLEENAGSAQTVQCSSSKKSSTWEIEDADAPGVPESFTKVAESKFPICAEEFFTLFFSDNGVNFQESFHGKCGDKDFNCSSWHRDAKLGHTRNVSFQHPIKIYFGSRFGSCQELQKYRVYRNSHLIVDTSQDISDVPYGDYFSVEARWDVEEESSGSMRGCILRVYVNVAFSKKTMWKGKIVQSTVEETREAYATWIELAHEVLKQKHLEKEEGARAPSLVSVVSNEQILLEAKKDIQNNVIMNSNSLGISQTIPDVNRLVTGPLHGSIGEAPVGSLNFVTYLKRQKSPVLFLVATLAVILILLQISIIVLMSRPQRIHVISQSDCTRSLSGVGESRGEIVDSMWKQIRYLKEEMHFMETFLDKMQHEHSLLKEKLKDLELFRNQRI